jgi:hypothetical protein
MVTITACAAAEMGESGWPVVVNRADVSANQSDPHPDNAVSHETPVRVGVGDLVWADTNVDGLQDPGEPGLADVEVELYQHGNNIPFTTTTTDSEGFYVFFQMPAGDYKLLFEAPDGYTFTQQIAGDPELDSDANQSGETRVFSVELGLDYFHLDAGLYATPSVGDRVWLDTNGNGEQDDGEAGVENVTVNLYDQHGQQLISSTQTDAEGLYLFDGLQATRYKVEFELPSGYAFTLKGVGGDARDSDANDEGWTDVFELDAGEQNLDIDAGIYIPATVGDWVWQDDDADGVQDTGEDTGVQNVMVTLYLEGQPISTTHTDSTGRYTFTQLRPDVSYSLGFELPGVYTFTLQDAIPGDDENDSDPDRATGRTATFTLSSGEDITSWDAGTYELPSVGDRVWLDANGDGIQNDGSSGVSDVQVRLFRDGVDTGQSVNTGQVGHYVFTELEIGVPYSLAFQLPSGYVFSPINEGGDDTMDSDVYTTTGWTDTFILGPGQHDTRWDAGLIPVNPIGDQEAPSLPAGVQKPVWHYWVLRHKPW